MKEITFDQYYNKVHGSWLGRVAGDFVGAPVEFWPYEKILAEHGNIEYYPIPVDINEVNDDEMYEICALIALEKHGINLTARDIAQEWHDRLDKLIFTAEDVAMQNFKEGIWPPESGTHNNIYFDAIGAQMKADIWGQIAPGSPKVAKQYAEMDGSIAHAGIGIEGEVFVAVLIANAFFEEDSEKNINDSLKFLPPAKESLYTEMVLKAIEIYKKYPDDFRRARDDLIEYWDMIRNEKIEITGVTGSKRETRLARKRRFFIQGSALQDTAQSVHVLPNIGIIILSLLYGKDDKEDPLGKSICIAAMMGLDTDCNCGNIGAILGAQLGADKIPTKWTDPLQDTFSTYVKGYEKWKISDLAMRIAKIGENVIKEKCKDTIKIIP